MKVDTEAPEIKKLVDMNLPTGNEELDNLLLSFRFDSVMVIRILIGLLFTPIMIPIAKRFENIPSILNIEIGPSGFDDHTIYLDRQNENKSTIIFSAGFGDCPAGCFNHINWEFEVENNEADFIRSYKTQG